MPIPATAAEAFLAQYEANVHNLSQGSAGDLPPAVMTYPGERGQEATHLAVTGMHMLDIDGDRAPAFDISVGQKGRLHPVSGTAAMPTHFAEDQEWAAYVGSERALVTLDPREMADRRRLLTLAHEVGHTHDTPFVVGALTLAAERPLDSRIESELSAFKPAVDALKDYAARTPSFKREARALLDAGVPPTTEASELVQHNINIYYAEASHPEAGIAISSLREAAAWRRAIHLAEGGSLRPGMSRAEMHREAAKAVATYDKQRGTTLHGDTLTRGLRSVRRKP